MGTQGLEQLLLADMEPAEEAEPNGGDQPTGPTLASRGPLGRDRAWVTINQGP